MPKYSSLALAVCACYENVDEKTLNKAATNQETLDDISSVSRKHRDGTRMNIHICTTQITYKLCSYVQIHWYPDYKYQNFLNAKSNNISTNLELLKLRLCH